MIHSLCKKNRYVYVYIHTFLFMYIVLYISILYKIHILLFNNNTYGELIYIKNTLIYIITSICE